MTNVLDFPKPPEAPKQPLLIGPFTYHSVIVEGRVIPHLTGHPQEDGRVTLIVDDRFAVDFPADLADSAAWLLANALAVGAGYSHLAAATKDRVFAPVGMQIGPIAGPPARVGEGEEASADNPTKPNIGGGPLDYQPV